MVLVEGDGGCSLDFLTLRLVRPLKYSWFCWKVMSLFSRFSYLEVGEAFEVLLVLLEGDELVLQVFLP